MPPPVPRLSLSAEAARAAAQQAEFNEKKWVWVPDEKEGYLAGWVNKEDDDMGEIVMAAGGEFRRVPLLALSKMNPPKFDRVEDIADLTFLNEASVVHNLRLRYGSGAIYTYSGLFLVAINPYQALPLYSDAVIQQYRNKRRDENPPHIFAVAERAWINMGDEHENQSILITGESGAGKTESTKKVIQYLAAIATDVHGGGSNESPMSPTSTGLGRALSRTNSTMPATGLPRNANFRPGNASSQSYGGHIRSQSRGHALTQSGSGSQIRSKTRLGLLERQILQANPILEAFGNAQTQRNNNSSRFGKFVRISFAPDGSIAGANIDWYLLEKSRVVVRSEAERNFHVFYQLMAGSDESFKDSLLLRRTSVEDYEYLNKSRREVDGVDDVVEWRALLQALDVVGFSAEEQFDLFRVVAAVLHIGNIAISATRADDAVMPDPSQAERVCYLLGIPVAEFTRAVLRPRVLAGREWVSQARTKQQAFDELAALCKTLYEKSFGALVDRVNVALGRPPSGKNGYTSSPSSRTFIGVLDIAGFEIFDVNGYEQLLINYTNERLQQFFNHHMFVLEQEEYAREGIKWDYVNFGLDLQPTIDLIESTGANDGCIGILSCLDEECIMPKATDATFTNKLDAMWGRSNNYTGGSAIGSNLSTLGLDDDGNQHGRMKYERARFEQGFIIHHYAAKVEYHTEGWLEKNKDPLNDNLTRVLAASSERYIAGLFSEFADNVSQRSGSAATGSSYSTGKKRGLKKGAFRTVGQRHKEQLASLMAQLQATQPHFVRCIVPNSMKKPGRVDVPLVLDQLRCNGVLEGIRIARLGYPNRLPFVEFRQRYEILTPGIIPPGYMDGREACKRMVNSLELDDSLFKIGTSKIFFKAGVLAELEERRDLLLYDIFSRFEAAGRMWAARRQMRKILNRAVAIRTIQRNARIYGELREWPWWQLYTKVRPLLAATRNDDELRRKEVELQLVKERAEHDKQEREKLERLRMSLESDKRKIEDALEAERALALDKDALLERSKKREAELEEEILALQADLDTLDSQLDRAMSLQKETDEKYEQTKQMFDQAAEHLVRLESQEKEWTARDQELTAHIATLQEDLDAMNGEVVEYKKVAEDLKDLALQREEDLDRAKDRANTLTAELQGKLDIEIRNRELAKDKADALDTEARQAKEQLAEMARTANDYSSMIQKKEQRMVELVTQIETFGKERDALKKEIMELKTDIDTLAAELATERDDRAQSVEAQRKLQTELDELRTLLDAKSSEETRREEAAQSREQELSDLRSQVAHLKSELSESRKTALDVQSKLKRDLDHAVAELESLKASHASLLAREQTAQSQLNNKKVAHSELEKVKRGLESELQALRTRQTETQDALAEAEKIKESLERQLTAAQNKYLHFDEIVIEMERDKATHNRQLEANRKQIETDTAKRTQLEQTLAANKADLAKLKDYNVKLERDLKKALSDLKEREWEIKQLESRQDKTIVEHVHVLEEAKRVTDRQLREAQLELSRSAAHIRSLEKNKQRLTGEAEDVARQVEGEQLKMRTLERNFKGVEGKLTAATAECEKERKAKEETELQVQRLQNELRSTQTRATELAEQVAIVQKSKDNLETELDRLADQTTTPNSMAKIQRQYEGRIKALESQLEDAQLAKTTAARIRERVERQHAEIRRLVMSSAPVDSAFQARLIQELQRLDDDLAKEMTSRAPSTPSKPRVSSNLTGEFQRILNGSPSKRGPDVARSRRDSLPVPASDKQVASLKQQISGLELQMAASERVRHHLEGYIREMNSDLENSDWSKQFLEKHKTRLSEENARLSELFAEEAEARRVAEAAQVDGIQSMWSKFQSTITEERDNYSRLEESRKALLVQQRTTQSELDTQRAQVRELAQSKKQLQAQATSLKEEVQAARSEASNTKRQLQKQIQDQEVALSVDSAAHAELLAAVESFKAKEVSYQQRLEAAEIARAKAARGDAFARRSLADLEKAQGLSKVEHTALQKQLQAAEKKITQLQRKFDEESREASDLDILHQRLTEELEDEREQHQKDLAERDFAADQTRKKYQAELAQLSEELQSQRDSLSQLREENRKIRSDHDELQLRFDDEVYSSGGWKKEKERMETKIGDVTKAYEAAVAAQAEQQSQIVSLHSQVRELRSVLDDAEADRALLQKARRALQAELEEIKLDQVDTSKLTSDHEYQMLHLKKQDLERALEEQEDRVTNAFDRMKKAEGYANECQIELGKIRVENSELDRLNAHLEKQIKELNVRIVDLETKSYTNSPRTFSRHSRADEITSQLTGSSPRVRTIRDKNFQVAEVERQRAKLDEERKSYEAQITSLRKNLDDIQTEESQLQSAKRRAEREAADYRQKSLNLERELERLRNRLERPASTFSSPVSSPRK